MAITTMTITIMTITTMTTTTITTMTIITAITTIKQHINDKKSDTKQLKHDTKHD